MFSQVLCQEFCPRVGRGEGGVYPNMQWAGGGVHPRPTTPLGRHPFLDRHPPPPRWLLNRAVRVLLEYILV